MKQKTIRDCGVVIGSMTPGSRNRISDVPGVTVGHCTVKTQDHQTGVTVILPSEQNLFAHPLPAASFVWNGFGKTLGTIQIEELGRIETPIALTNTLNVGLVHDALVEYTARRCEADGVEMHSVNPVVGECNDCDLNDIRHRVIGQTEVFAAIDAATADFEMGDVGAGAGTICHYLKGGIGSASRVFEIDGRRYTLGVIVQSNYGKMGDLTVNGKRVGEMIEQKIALSEGSQVDKGSIMMILATDLPLSDRQLKRVIKRMSVGLARLGSYIGQGSGEIMIGFSTAQPIASGKGICTRLTLGEDAMDVPFRAAAECCEEAVLNSMITAAPAVMKNGKKVWSLSEFADLL